MTSFNSVPLLGSCLVRGDDVVSIELMFVLDYLRPGLIYVEQY